MSLLFPLFRSRVERVSDVQTMTKLVGKLYTVAISVPFDFVCSSLKPVLIKYLTFGLDLHVESTTAGHLLHCGID